MTDPRPASPAEAVQRAIRLLSAGGCYALGTGDYRPRTLAGVLTDQPWTERERDHLIGCDCAGLICWAYKLERHRPGYNRGGEYDVEDDLNSNSFLGDAMGARDLFTLVADSPRLGDVIAYPSFYLYDDQGKRLQHDGQDLHWIGHVALVVGISRYTDWRPDAPQFSQLDIVQVKGPDRRAPAAVATDGSVFDHHNAQWPKEKHRAWLLRAVA
jgi:hypothetical protein